MEPPKDPKKIPKENSYYYWWDEKNKSGKKNMPPQNVPKKISRVEAQKLNESSTSNNRSAWNALGTWEEKIFKVQDFQTYLHENPGKRPHSI